MPPPDVVLSNSIKKLTSPMEKIPKTLSDLVNALNRTAKAIEDYNRLERTKQAYIQQPRTPDGQEHT